MFSRSVPVENNEIIETPSLSSRGYLQALTMKYTWMAERIIACVKGGFSRDFTIRRRDGNKKKKGLEDKTITLQAHHTFLYISLPFLHD